MAIYRRAFQVEGTASETAIRQEFWRVRVEETALRPG